MRAFERRGDACVAEVEEFEVALLTSLAEQLRELLGGPDAPALDGLDAFERLAASAEEVELDFDDPLIARLFPDAYGVADLDEEYRRYTLGDARRQRVEEATAVLADLAETGDGRRPLVVPPERLGAWLRVVNALRLSLSVRLGVTDAASLYALDRLSPRDRRAHLLDIYEWLGFVLESLLEASD